MESSAPKRRKTSPTSSFPVESTTPPDPPPQQQPPELQPTPESPTRSSGLGHQVESIRAEELPASQRDSPDDDDIAASNVPTAQSENPSEGDGTASSSAFPPRDASATAHGPPSDAGASQETSRSRSPVRRAGGTTLGAQPARRSPSRPQPRPLPPPAPENEEDLFNPFIGRALQRSPLNTGVLPAVEHQEPELPPTPHHPDPVVSTPPSGIHLTPSKRRRQGVAGRLAQQQSPSKGASQEQHGPPQKESQRPRTFRVARRGSPVQVVEQQLPEVHASRDLEEPKSEFAPGTHPRRSIRLNPLAAKQRERDELLREVAQLEADLELATRDNQAVARNQSSSADSSDVLDLFLRHLLPTQKDKESESTSEWLETAMNPIAMLGFNGSSSAFLPPPMPQKEEEPEPPPTSHHPIPMSAPEELPYLQVFTPLTFTSKSTTISAPSEHGDPMLKKLSIRVASATPPGLFVAEMEMTVNTRTLAVSSLAVPKLDPASARELQPFINSIISRKATPHSALTRNVSVLAWAMGEWYRVALKRAKFWYALEKQLGPEAKDGLPEVVKTMRTRRKRKRRARDADDGSGSFDSADSPGASLDSMLLSKADLLPHMGRSTIDLDVPCLAEQETGTASQLRVSWGIEFDWTGEARSKLGVEVGVPGKWQASDDRKSITGIPTLFDRLVQGGEDPLTAVKTVVALLAGEPAS